MVFMQLRPNIAKQINIPGTLHIPDGTMHIWLMNTATAFTVSYKQHFENESCIARLLITFLKEKL